MTREFCIVSPRYLPSVGGVQRYTACLADELVNLGHRVTIVTNNEADLPDREEERATRKPSFTTVMERKPSLTIVRLPCHSLLSGRYPVPRRDNRYRELMTWLDEQHFDGIVIQTRFYPLSREGAKLGAHLGVRPVVIDHGSAHLTMGSPLLDPFVAHVEHRMTDRLKTFDADYYAVSQAGVQWLTHFGIEAKGVLHNAINASAFRAQASTRNFREEFRVPPEAFVLAFTGRVSPEKGVDKLVAALNETRGIHGFIAGDGPLRASLEKASSPYIHWTGTLSAADVSALLSQSQVICLPTRSEGFSTSLLEAGAWGVIPVVTQVGGVSELMLEERYGKLLHSTEPHKIASVLQALAATPTEVSAMGALLKERVEVLFSWKATARAVIDACEAAQSHESA